MPSALPKEPPVKAKASNARNGRAAYLAPEPIAKAAFEAYFSEQEAKKLIGNWDTLTTQAKQRWIRVSLAVLEAAEIAALK
ncbi:MAG: hypothetical protein DMF63_08355 [Acidobacteria bacterium]|nr:MAG: hypothetical protein DMF63_08355 [Acidobacteriota bacterium]